MLQQTVILPTTKNLVLDLCLLEMFMAFENTALPLHRCRSGVLRAQSTKRKERSFVPFVFSGDKEPKDYGRMVLRLKTFLDHFQAAHTPRHRDPATSDLSPT